MLLRLLLQLVLQRLPQYRMISAEAVALISKFSNPHAPETRWERVARIAAEEKAKKEAAEAETENSYSR